MRSSTIYQGSLDGLCGVYSIMNCIEHQKQRVDRESDDTWKRRSTLFRVMIENLAEQKVLDKAVIRGIEIENLIKLVRLAADLEGFKSRMAVEILGAGTVRLPKDDLEKIRKHLNENGPGSAIILFVDHRDFCEDHYSCVAEFGDFWIELTDSYVYSRLEENGKYWKTQGGGDFLASQYVCITQAILLNWSAK